MIEEYKTLNSIMTTDIKTLMDDLMDNGNINRRIEDFEEERAIMRDIMDNGNINRRIEGFKKHVEVQTRRFIICPNNMDIDSLYPTYSSRMWINLREIPEDPKEDHWDEMDRID